MFIFAALIEFNYKLLTMRKNLFLAIALLLGITTLQAKPVEINTAQRLGLSFVKHKALFAQNDVQSIELAHVFHTESGMTGA
jgi:hypothetical protein